MGAEHVHLEEGTAVSLDQGTRIDLGAIAKGYASDRMAAIYQEHGITHGIVDLGGNTWVCGGNLEGEPWQIGIQDPARSAGALAGILEASDAFAVTSGGYQRYFEENGQVYHHIIDPATGRPAESGLTSVTVVADGAAGNGTMCDALSTALFVMGEDRALELWRSGVYDFDLILVPLLRSRQVRQHHPIHRLAVRRHYRRQRAYFLSPSPEQSRAGHRQRQHLSLIHI